MCNKYIWLNYKTVLYYCLLLFLTSPATTSAATGCKEIKKTSTAPKTCWCAGQQPSPVTNTEAQNNSQGGRENDGIIVTLSKPATFGFQGFLEANTFFLEKTTACIDPECGQRYGKTNYTTTETCVPPTPQQSKTNNNAATIWYAQFTDPKNKLAIMSKAGDEVISIFGEKDSQGRLVHVEGLMFSSLTDKNKHFTLELTDSYFPKKIHFPDDSSIEFVNYDRNGATVLYQNGNKITTAYTQLPISKLKQATIALKKYTESPQPNLNDANSSIDMDMCHAIMDLFHEVASNLLWGTFQLINISLCSEAVAGAIAGTVVSGGAATPLSLALVGWGCGSTVLNGIDHAMEATTQGNSPFKQFNDVNSFANWTASCATRDWSVCSSYVAEKMAGELLKQAQPQTDPCRKKPQSEKNYECCYEFEKFCKAKGGVAGIWKDSCSCNISSVGHPALCEPGENPCGPFERDLCFAGGHMCIDRGKQWPYACK